MPAIYVAGLNFKSHAREVGLELPKAPIFAMKSPASLLYQVAPVPDTTTKEGPFLGQVGSEIRLPTHLRATPEVDYEGELGVFILEDCRDVTVSEAADGRLPLAFACAIDVTARRQQGRIGDNQWCVAKSFDTFCPVGPSALRGVSWNQFVLGGRLDGRDGDPQTRTPPVLVTKLNHAVVQESPLSDMIFDVPALIHSLSRGATLKAGSLLLCGTPAGVGYCRKGPDGQPSPRYLTAGDVVSVTIDGIGTLGCSVANASEHWSGAE